MKLGLSPFIYSVYNAYCLKNNLTLCMLILLLSPFSLQQFCGVLGHTFMEFLKGSGDYCQAQHDLYADK